VETRFKLPRTVSSGGGGSCENGNETSGDIKGGETIIFSRGALFHGVCYTRN
jgi:hypothetical protein